MTPPYRLARGGPSPHARVCSVKKAEQGREAWVLHFGQHLGFREIGAHLGVSATTAWRRFWFWCDYLDHPKRWGMQRDHVPPQRGTRECPRGAPPILDRPPAPRLPHPLPALQCCARRKRDGHRCGRWAVRGATVCPSHGGNAPQVRRVAAERVRVAVAADRELRTRLTPLGVLAPAVDGLTVAQVRARVLATDPSWLPVTRGTVPSGRSYGTVVPIDRR